MFPIVRNGLDLAKRAIALAIDLVEASNIPEPTKSQAKQLLEDALLKLVEACNLLDNLDPPSTNNPNPNP